MLIGNVINTLVVVVHVRQIFSFPDPVNETSARLVATGVVAQAAAFLIFREGWLLVPLVFGFAARVLTGPTLSPLGQFSTRIATPFVERRFGIESWRVPGPPKRFAQMIGLAFSGGAAIGWATGATWVTSVLLAGLLVAASLEAFLAICLGCIAYSAIWGCDDCDDISERLSQAMLRARAAAPADLASEASRDQMATERDATDRPVPWAPASTASVDASSDPVTTGDPVPTH